MPIFHLIFSLLQPLAGGTSPSGASIAQELTDIHRGMHARCMGYLDAGQIQDLVAADRLEHKEYGNLLGFHETRRVTAMMMGPDSAAISRVGLMGSYQSGGWTRDLYLTSPPSLHEQARRWAAGVAAANTDQDWFAAGGWFHTDPVEWKDELGYRTEEVHNDFWAMVRYQRYGMLAVGGIEGFRMGRIGLLPDPAAFGKYEKHWFWPQVEAAMVWNQADWNPWSDQDALGAELRLPLLGERVSGRLEAGSDGFRLLQFASNLDPQGNVGVDLSWSRTRAGDGPGFRFRAPLLTFSWNDPDDIAAFGISHRGMVWSIRLQMTWERGEMWYHPGRRPDAGGSL